MNLWVNDKKYELNKEQVTVSDLINRLGLSEQGSALAVNDVIVPRSRWTSSLLSDGDRISLFQVIAGG